jgi:hypothetical protein
LIKCITIANVITGGTGGTGTTGIIGSIFTKPEERYALFDPYARDCSGNRTIGRKPRRAQKRAQRPQRNSGWIASSTSPASRRLAIDTTGFAG